MVSAIVPVFNAENTLVRAVDSILIQPEVDELILVEDGSTDRSLELCRLLESRHRKIKVLQHPRGGNRGAPESRNLGLSFAKNEWIQFMDADDQLLPGKISDQLSRVKDGVDLILGKVIYINQDGSESLINPFKDVWSGLIATRLGYTSSILWRKSAVIKAGGWDVNLLNIQEYNLIFSMLKLGSKVNYSNLGLTRVYFLANSITNSSEVVKEKRDHYFKFREEIRNYLIEKKQFTLKRRHHFNSVSGLMLKYHQPEFKVNLDRFYFWLYSKVRSIKKTSRSLKIGISGVLILLFISILIKMIL